MRAGTLYMAVMWTFLIVSIASVCIVEYVYAKRDREKVRAAQNMELEEGITLFQAIRAYYGEDGLWLAGHDVVYVFAGSSRSRKGELSVNPETGEVVDREDGREKDKAESAALVKAMVQAVKRGDRGPWPL